MNGVLRDLEGCLFDITTMSGDLKRLDSELMTHIETLGDCIKGVSGVLDDETVSFKDEMGLEFSKVVLEERLTVLRTSEKVALQLLLMLNNHTLVNEQLLRKINTVLNVTAPALKSAMIHALQSSRQTIGADPLAEIETLTVTLLKVENENNEQIKTPKTQGQISVDLRHAYDTLAAEVENVRRFMKVLPELL